MIMINLPQLLASFFSNFSRINPPITAGKNKTSSQNQQASKSI